MDFTNADFWTFTALKINWDGEVPDVKRRV
jgi:hypothetical protein